MLSLATTHLLTGTPYMSDQERQIRCDLAAAYHIMSHHNMADLTYAHLSARAPDGDSFYIYPFGLLFEEVTASQLLKVNFDGHVLEGSEYQYNQTGYIIHGQIYAGRPDIQAIFHYHTPASVAVSTHPQGLMPLSQWALHFYEKIGYHSYNSLALEAKQGHNLLHDLENNNILIMRHHGVITCGRTLPEAHFYAYHLEQACKTQCLISHHNLSPLPISPEICKKTVDDLLNFEKNLGERDWNAMIRMLERQKILYKDL